MHVNLSFSFYILPFKFQSSRFLTGTRRGAKILALVLYRKEADAFNITFNFVVSTIGIVKIIFLNDISVLLLILHFELTNDRAVRNIY